jgi:predicted transcriptional regulator
MEEYSKELRQKLGLSQNQMATKLGVTRSTIQRRETKHSKNTPSQNPVQNDSVQDTLRALPEDPVGMNTVEVLLKLRIAVELTRGE